MGAGSQVSIAGASRAARCSHQSSKPQAKTTSHNQGWVHVLGLPQEPQGTSERTAGPSGVRAGGHLPIIGTSGTLGLWSRQPRFKSPLPHSLAV